MWKIVELFLRVVVPAAAALVLAAVLVARRAQVDHDLRVFAPASVRPGSTLPVRLALLGQLQAIEGAKLIAAPVTIELRDSSGHALGSVLARPGFARTMEADLPLPNRLRGTVILRAIAELPDRPLSVEAPVTVRQDAAAAPVKPRQFGELQQLAADMVHAEGVQDTPPDLQVRVTGGACVPEQRCQLLVRVGPLPLSVQVEENASVTPLTRASVSPIGASGIVSLSVITHGPEAILDLAAKRGDQTVATSSIRLPVALPASYLQVESAIWSYPAKVRLRLETRFDETKGCIIDGFSQDRWVFTRSFEDCASSGAVLAGELTTGIWRIQARRDPFGADSASVRMLYIRRPGESDTQVLASVARYAAARDPQDSYAKQAAAQPERFTAGTLEQTAVYLLAPQENDLIHLPVLSSSYPAELYKLEARRAVLRRYALVAVALAGLALGLRIARRGLVASAQARQIMAEAGDPTANHRAKKLRMTLTVLAAVAALALVFVAVAMYIVARSSALY